MEKSTKFREEGNRLFQADQTPQAILFYNKSLVYAPHPDYEEYTWPTGKGSSKNDVTAQRDDGGRGVKNDPNFRDVICG